MHNLQGSQWTELHRRSPCRSRGWGRRLKIQRQNWWGRPTIWCSDFALRKGSWSLDRARKTRLKKKINDIYYRCKLHLSVVGDLPHRSESEAYSFLISTSSLPTPGSCVCCSPLVFLLLPFFRAFRRFAVLHFFRDFFEKLSEPTASAHELWVVCS